MRLHRGTLAVAAAVIALAAVWSLGRGPGAPSAGESVAPGADSSPDRADQPGRPARPARPEAAVHRTASPAPEPGEIQHAAGEPPALVVQVLGPDASPVAGVPVQLLHERPGTPYVRPAGGASTDGEGLARLNVLEARGSAASGGTWKVALALPLDPPVEHLLGSRPPVGGFVLLSLPDAARGWLEPLRVAVVDARGAPAAGVTVAFRAVPRGSPRGSHELGRGRSREGDGLVLFGPRRQLEFLAGAARRGTVHDLEVFVSGPYVEAPRAGVPNPPGGGEPVRVTLPPAAPVVVEVRTAAGTPAGEGAYVTLGWRPLAAGEEQGFRGGRTNRRDAAGGAATFEHVGLGLELELEAGLHDGSVEPVRQTAPGPVAADREHRLAVALGPSRPRLEGRLLDAEGKPLPWLRFALSTHARHPPRDELQRGDATVHHADGEGRFRVQLTPPPSRGGPHDLRFLERPYGGTGSATRVPCYAEVALPAGPPGGGAVALGDLVLQELPIVAAGRVEDGRGEAVHGALVIVRPPPAGGSGRRPTDERGSFEVRGLTDAAELELRAELGSLGRSDPVAVAAGTADAVLVVRSNPPDPYVEAAPGGRLQGRVLLDDGVPAGALEVVVRPEGGAARSGYLTAGRFAFDPVPPGAADVEVRTARTGWVLERVERVAVEPGLESADPRVETIDLRGRVRLLRLRLLRPLGTPVSLEEVRITAGGGGGVLRTDESGRLEAAVRAGDARFRVRVEGYRELEVDWLPAEQELRLFE